MHKDQISLNTRVSELRYISSKYEILLNKLGIYSVKDLITYFPRSYSDSSEITKIIDVFGNLEILDKNLLIKGKVINFKNSFIRFRKSIQTLTIQDDTASIACNFFNQPFLERSFYIGSEVMLFGKAKLKGKKHVFYPNSYDTVKKDKESVHLGRISPEYSLTQGLSKKWLRNRIKEVVDKLNNEKFIIPDEIFQIVGESKVKSSLMEAHFPSSYDELDKAKEILSLLELINIFFKIQKHKKVKAKKFPKLKIDVINYTFNEFLTKIPFVLTEDQKTVLANLNNKLKSQNLLNELIQGDVGSGKTIICIYLSYLFAQSGFQSVILAPTTILAKQHYETFSKILKDTSIELVISNKKEANKALILIGTTALLARKSNLIENAGLLVVDEQHRFGVRQREELLNPLIYNEKLSPHFINMTATPIPRTIAETFFTDIDVHTIKNKPKDRKPITTFLVPEPKRENSYQWIREEILSKNQQVYLVCPLIEENEIIDAKAALTTFKEIKKIFTKHKVALMHGKLKPEEKEQIMTQYTNKKIDILVSTSVIEVGIDVPNSTVIVIENAERFGLAQLHQIRGRVGRGSEQSYCLLFYSNNISEDALKRLQFIKDHNNGLDIAEFDLSQRGPGEVYGTKQSGIPNLKIAKLTQLDLIKKAKDLSKELLKRKISEIELFS